MTERLKPFVATIAAVASLFVVLLAPASAATSPTTVSGAGNGLKVSPVHSDLTINPGQSAVVDVYITNVTNQPATFQVTINDFVARNDESGNPALILTPDQSVPSHSLRQFVGPISNIVLQPNQQKDVKVPINIPTSATPGGYYGAVRFAAASNSGASKNVSLSASVASLILVKVPGDIKEQMSIASFDTRVDDKIHSWFTSSKGINGVVRFQNTGNIQEQPFGKLTVKSTTGKVVYSVEVNNGAVRGSVLPDSIRKFAIPLKNLGAFGRYTVTGDFGYASGQTLTATTTFYVIPIAVVIVALIILVLLIIAIFEIPRMIKRYNKRVLRRAGRY